jgi:hypothetical protein
MTYLARNTVKTHLTQDTFFYPCGLALTSGTEVSSVERQKEEKTPFAFFLSRSTLSLFPWSFIFLLHARQRESAGAQLWSFTHTSKVYC